MEKRTIQKGEIEVRVSGTKAIVRQGSVVFAREVHPGQFLITGKTINGSRISPAPMSLFLVYGVDFHSRDILRGPKVEGIR